MSKCIKTGDFLTLSLSGYWSCTFFAFLGLVLSTTFFTSACMYRDLPCSTQVDILDLTVHVWVQTHNLVFLTSSAVTVKATTSIFEQTFPLLAFTSVEVVHWFMLLLAKMLACNGTRKQHWMKSNMTTYSIQILFISIRRTIQCIYMYDLYSINVTRKHQNRNFPRDVDRPAA